MMDGGHGPAVAFEHLGCDDGAQAFGLDVLVAVEVGEQHQVADQHQQQDIQGTMQDGVPSRSTRDARSTGRGRVRPFTLAGGAVGRYCKDDARGCHRGVTGRLVAVGVPALNALRAVSSAGLPVRVDSRQYAAAQEE
jgi:hypothetical protein